jgi:hypothetical protein
MFLIVAGCSYTQATPFPFTSLVIVVFHLIPARESKKRCRLSWLTNSALVYEPKCGGRGGVSGSQSMSTAVQYTGAQINFGELNPHLIYDSIPSVNAKHFSKIRIFCPPEKFKALQSVKFTFGVAKNNNIFLCSKDRTECWAISKIGSP